MFVLIGGSVFFSSLVYFLAAPLFGIFTRDTEIIALGTKLLLISIFIDSLQGANTGLGTALLGCGDAKYFSYVGTGILVFFFLPLAYLLGIYWEYGLVGIWFATLADVAIRFPIFYARWRSRKWEKMGVLENLSDSKYG